MTNQSACRFVRGNYPSPYTERQYQRSGRSTQSYSARTDSHASRAVCPIAEQDACNCETYTSSEVCVSPAEFPIGMTYTPMQQWKNLYCASKALEQGTLFADLDKPFFGRRGSR